MIFIIIIINSSLSVGHSRRHVGGRDSCAGGTAPQRWWFFPCRVDCIHQAALPHVCVADDHLPCTLQHAKRAFSLKRVRLFKDDATSGKLDVASL